MPTDVTKTIAATSSPTTPDYTTLQAWEDACPANLVTDDKRWIGECLDQGEFVSAGNPLTISGQTVDATRYIILRCQSGASFRDKAGVRTTALFYSASNGVAVRVTNGYVMGIDVQTQYTRLEGLQVKLSSANPTTAIGWSVADVRVEGCIAENQVAPLSSTGASSTVTVINCLLVARAQTGATTGVCKFTANANLYGCTIVNVGSVDGNAVRCTYATVVLENCAMFGCTTSTSAGAGGAYTGTDYCATDAASISAGSHNVTSLTFSSQFESSSNDFRAKSSGGLQAGTPDATNMADDISRLTRSLSTVWIGAWEISSASAIYRTRYWVKPVFTGRREGKRIFGRLPTQPTPFDVNGTWVCPADVQTANVKAWGGGMNGATGVGGGGGAFAEALGIRVTPGNSYTVTVGAATDDSSFGDGTKLFAAGCDGRLGALAGSCIGDNTWGGGNGGTASTGGGGGGGSASPTEAGINGTNGSVGAGGIGGRAFGRGGDGGGPAAGTGGDGTVPGGGAGGAGVAGVDGAGAHGRVLVQGIPNGIYYLQGAEAS